MQLRIILKFPSRQSETSFTQLSREKRSLLLFLTKVVGTFRACLCGGMSRGCGGGWGGDKEVGGEGERERDAFYEVCFIGQFVAEPETGPLLCRTALWDCFKDTNTASFIGSVSFS